VTCDARERGFLACHPAAAAAAVAAARAASKAGAPAAALPRRTLRVMSLLSPTSEEADKREVERKVERKKDLF
jgi:hypothetical protein